MKFIQFKIRNYKGIESIIFDLDKSPDANIYTLVGLNESGKTTILEAISSFDNQEKGLSGLDIPKSIKDYNDLIPISRRDNFNDTISLEVTLKLEPEDLIKINQYTIENTNFKSVQKKDTIIYYRNYHYKNSSFTSSQSLWSGFYGVPKDSSNGNNIFISKTSDEKYGDDNLKLSNLCLSLIPSIIYFPNFLFDFPSRIYLETKIDPTPKEKFYIELIQDILNSLNNDTSIKIHIVDRIKDQSQKRNLDRLIQLMQTKVSEVIFDAWNRIFKRQITDTRIIISYNVDGENLSFLEFEIEAQDGIYQLNERSLGFKWFFIFLLFTQFRPFRKDTPTNIIFLFDEPGSNLHSTAQKQLLKSFENLQGNSKVIYTTHSHHLINPNWLESTYVVKNEGLHLESPEAYNIKKTKISIEPYKEFAAKHPHNTAYFQPILDVLDYVPSDLENIPKCIFLEGKNDYYTLAYFKDVIFSGAFDLNMAPSTGSGNLDTLITLYIGWGKKFLVLLDSDKAGKHEKQRYLDKFGILLEQSIYLISDIDPSWDKRTTETIFEKNDLISFQLRSYPNSSTFNKTHFNRSIQESLINKTSYNFCEETLNNFSKVLHFLSDKMKNA